MAERRGARGRSGGPSLFAAAAPPQPLAARMRPRTLDEYVGQRHLLAPGMPLRESIERGVVSSMVFWGPPGTGKTTLARLVARYTDREFVSFSAVTEGVPRVREIVREAEDRLETGRGTILFADEIHRFNKAQQDAFLPHVEAGTIVLIGATTENPSFEIIGALLSRVRVFVLRPLAPADVAGLVRRALGDAERGLGEMGLTVDDDAIDLLSTEADGDARRALTVLEAAARKLFIHIRDFGEKLFEEKNIQFRAFNEVREKIKLPYGFSREANLIFKEAMTNAFKYSEAKNVSLQLKRSEDNLGFEMSLEDDGIGFSTDEISKSNGLKNLRERADRIHGLLRITSVKKSGTKITLSFKLSKTLKYGLAL
jgi:DNA polymerase III delta prime subunit